MDLVRKMVSKKKRRFEMYNFDLDLSYITDRVIAMGFPSESLEGLYRNRMRDVQRFFNTLHPDHYKVFNLCSERKYEHCRFENRVSEYPFDDHCPPTLNIIAEFCNDIEMWLDQNPENVIAVHCKAGKGRTGTMLACWLLYNKQCQTGSESMRLFANKRTHNSKGVTIPSQIRYVRYFEALLQYGKPVPKPPSITKVLSIIKMNSLPNFNIGGGCEPYLSIVQQGKTVFYSKPVKLKKGTIHQQVELDCGNILLVNDVQIQFFNRNSKGHMFSYCFHTAFIEGTKIHIRRQEIDKAHKDIKHFPSNFSIELIFLEDDRDDDSSLVSEESVEEKRVFNTSYATGLAKLYHHNNSSNKSLTSSTSSTNNTSDINNSDTNNNNNNNNNSNNNNNTFVNNLGNNTSGSAWNTSKIIKNRGSRLAFICPKCTLPITSTDPSINRNSENYHWKCVVCVKCSKPLGGEIECVFENNEMLCRDCGTEFFKSCSGCNLVIKTTDFEELGNYIYHRSCFLCFYCTSYLGGKDFIVENSNEETTNRNGGNGFGLRRFKCSGCIENKNRRKQNQNGDETTIEHKIPELCDKLDEEIIKLVIEIDRSTEPSPVSSIDPTNIFGNDERRHQMAVVETMICSKCELPISQSRPIILDCGIYHRECFQCSECLDETPMDPSLYYIRNDKPVCFDCDINHIMNEAHSEIQCYGCKQPIVDEVMMDALNFKWHVGCLVCSKCGIQIEGQLGDHQGLIYCKDHFEELIGTKCDQCNQYIDGMFLKVNGKNLCPTCFRCFCCNDILEGGKYFEKNGESICGKCRNEDILKRKTQIHIQHTLITSLKNSQQISDTENEIERQQSSSPPSTVSKPIVTITTTTTTTTTTGTNSNIGNSVLSSTSSTSTSPSTSPSISPLSSSIQKDAPLLCLNKSRSLFRNSIKIHLEDLKNSGERKTSLYPSFHRQMRKQTFKTAYPSLRGTKRKDFLNHFKNEVDSSNNNSNNNNNNNNNSLSTLVNAFIPPSSNT
ncbi:hypothetical protein RB653_000488 [Dictyostelium firmibasis]|uniref:Phosphatidylinositol-3,4,5-trisphosphate 3-phosphatase n=1 Tax=Dictyostelium firmibasis TaxID=79012 RepID=A0AAN7U722_9MYCE